MREFWDERGYEVTEEELYVDFLRMNRDGLNIDGLTFNQYIKNCTDKNGTLTEQKNNEEVS